MARGDLAQCVSCGNAFVQSHAGHQFCTRKCRYSGAKPPDEGSALARLFDPRRDADSLVAVDDWHPSEAKEWRELDAYDTVAKRRQWFATLRDGGQV